MQTTHTLEINKNEFEKYKNNLEGLESFAFKNEPTKTPYEVFRLRAEGTNVILFNSGKLLVQGKRTEELVKALGEINSSLNGNAGGDMLINEQVRNYKPHIGGDEVGKGDYFGPLVTCAAYCTKDNYSKLLETGVADSKKLSDRKIVQIADSLRSIVEFEIAVLNPEEYNSEIEKHRNVAIVLANLHAKSIENLVNRLNTLNYECYEIVIDQFSSVENRVSSLLGQSSQRVPFRQFIKGESDPIIAAASILARDSFLEQWDQMEQEWAVSFQKGASHVIENANKFLSLYGRESLNKVAKVSFKTTQQLNL